MSLIALSSFSFGIKCNLQCTSIAEPNTSKFDVIYPTCLFVSYSTSNSIFFIIDTPLLYTSAMFPSFDDTMSCKCSLKLINNTIVWSSFEYIICWAFELAPSLLSYSISFNILLHCFSFSLYVYFDKEYSSFSASIWTVNSSQTFFLFSSLFFKDFTSNFLTIDLSVFGLNTS